MIPRLPARCRPMPYTPSRLMRRAAYGWVPTAAALAQIVGSSDAPDSIRFRPVSHAEALSSHTVYGVVTDAKGRL